MTRCPSGRRCDWCGPKVAAEHRDARHATEVDDGLEEYALQEPPARWCGNEGCKECRLNGVGPGVPDGSRQRGK